MKLPPAKRRRRIFPYAPRLWIDLLPPDICERIVSCLAVKPSRHLTPNRHDPCSVSRHGAEVALPLAEVSPFQREVVKTALRGNVAIRDGASLKRWQDVLQHDAVALDVSCLEDQPILKELLACQTLEGVSARMHVSEGDDKMYALKSLPNLRALTVKVGIEKECDMDEQAFAEALSNRNLNELSLICYDTHDHIQRPCPLAQLFFSPDDWKFAFDSSISVLDISCDGLPRLTMWQFICSFPCLRELTWNDSLDRLPPDAFDKLQQFDILHLPNVSPNDLDVVCALGERVHSLGFDFSRCRDLNASDFERLKVCSQLRDLFAFLEPGAEERLDCLSKHLRSIQLIWAEWDGETREAHAPIPGTIYRFVRQAPSLVSLELCWVDISDEELKLALETMGPRLREFGLAIHGEVLPVERLMFVMHNLATFCCNLRRFLYVGFDGQTIVPSALTSEQCRRLSMSASVLHRHAPLAYMGKVDDFVARCVREKLGGA